MNHEIPPSAIQTFRCYNDHTRVLDPGQHRTFTVEQDWREYEGYDYSATLAEKPHLTVEVAFDEFWMLLVVTNNNYGNVILPRELTFEVRMRSRTGLAGKVHKIFPSLPSWLFKS